MRRDIEEEEEAEEQEEDHNATTIRRLARQESKANKELERRYTEG
jgi:hypothetical protein